jgi:hypothetical protein
VLCLVDDAQWLDQVSVQMLGFIARRLLVSDRVGVLFTVREGEDQATALAGLPELVIGGLPGEVAQELLATSAGAQVDALVSRRIAAGTAGNPLALVELAGELTPELPRLWRTWQISSRPEPGRRWPRRHGRSYPPGRSR